MFFGDPIMSLFGESYGNAAILLVILSVGFLADAATGPSRSVLMLTGHEKRYAAIFGLTTLASIPAQIVVLPSFGVIGVAIVSSLSRVLAYSLLSWQCAVKTGLDPTIFGILRLRSRSGGQDGAAYETHR
ncbi:polysaccharide biosynthesis C-terminal domain-containing protein [Devosia sp. A8/3-2]|nr:polysaccharide biosynthesis C-terminal domain-containing protein [Devosia sp. A8/3-2]